MALSFRQAASFMGTLPSLTLVDLFREQDRYEDWAERWQNHPQYPNQAQVVLCRQRARLIQTELDRRYRKGLRCSSSSRP